MKTALVVGLLGLAGVVIGAIITTNIFSKGTRRKVALGALGIVGAAMLVITIIGIVQMITGGRASSTSAAGSTKTQSSHASSSGTSAAHSPDIFTEIADSHLGAPVFRDATGAAAPADVPHKIPFGVKVHVACVAANKSGMSSVTAFYKIVGGKWDSLFAVTDTFANGDRLGDSSGGTAVDPAVPKCAG